MAKVGWRSDHICGSNLVRDHAQRGLDGEKCDKTNWSTDAKEKVEYK